MSGSPARSAARCRLLARAALSSCATASLLALPAESFPSRSSESDTSEKPASPSLTPRASSTAKSPSACVRVCSSILATYASISGSRKSPLRMKASATSRLNLASLLSCTQ